MTKSSKYRSLECAAYAAEQNANDKQYTMNANIEREGKNFKHVRAPSAGWQALDCCLRDTPPWAR